VVANRFVLDCSVTMAWCFADEATEFTAHLRRSLAEGREVLVPTHWPLEVTNALLVAERRDRVTPAQAARFLALLGRLPITFDPATPERAFTSSYAVAREAGLSSDDAAYLELAIRSGSPLATLDGKLATAARAAGITVLGA